MNQSIIIKQAKELLSQMSEFEKCAESLETNYLPITINEIYDNCKIFLQEIVE